MAVEIIIPKVGAGIDKVEIGKIYVFVGEEVKRGQPLFEIITFKASFDVESTVDGKVIEIKCKTGEEKNVLDVVGFIGDTNEAINKIDKIYPKEKIEINVRAMPMARKIAKENNIDIEKIFANSNKIITEQDVFDHINNSGRVISRDIPLRKKMEIELLNHSKEAILSSVTVVVSADSIRKNVEKISEYDKIRLTIPEYIMYNCAKILLNNPRINAFYEKEHINEYNIVNLGFAVNVYDELIVPVIKNANKIGLKEFSDKVKEIIIKVIRKEIQITDLEDCTFTISDLSSNGIIQFEPVINAKQSAILGICSEYDSIKIVNKQIVPEKKINLILRFDHRVIDGKYASNFLKELKDEVERAI